MDGLVARGRPPPADHRFGIDAPFQLGIEEELLLVDAESFALEAATEHVLAKVPSGAMRIRGEISEGMSGLASGCRAHVAARAAAGRR